LYEADCYIHQLSHYSLDREFSLACYSFKNMVFHPTWPTEWSPHVIMMAWKDYMYTGDDRALKFYYDDLKPKTLSALKCDNGLISTRTGLQTEEFLRSLHFKKKKPGTVENYPEHLVDIVDWPHEKGSMIPGGETDNYEFTDYNTVVNAFHYHALVTMGRIADACGHEDDAQAYRTEAEEFSKVFNDLLLIPGQGVYRDGVGSEHSSLHANLYPLAFGLVPAEHLESVLAHIKKKGMACGVYSANYLLEALFDHGEDEYAHRLMVDDGERSWVNMMRIGSTMTIEAWDNKFKKNNGWSHAWSASPAHIIPRKLMGVEPLTPGFEKIRIQPRLGMLREADLKIPTIRGDLEMKAQQDDKHFEVSLNLPGNTLTMLVIPLHGRNPALRNLEKDYPAAVIQGDRLIIDDLPPGPHTVRLLFE
jgi:alpha-L-rhamnosidase